MAGVHPFISILFILLSLDGRHLWFVFFFQTFYHIVFIPSSNFFQIISKEMSDILAIMVDIDIYYFQTCLHSRAKSNCYIN